MSSIKGIYTVKVILAIITFFILANPVIFVIGENTDPATESSSRQVDFTHAVFAEDITAEWCVYCPSASENLQRIYDSGDFPGNFYFVSMITEDMEGNAINEDAQARANDYQISGYPTVFFDGGYEEVVGGQTDESNYRAAIESCAVRTVPELDIELTGSLVVDQKIDINIKVINNGGGDYSGNLRIYVTEIVSRYNDFDGNPYPYGFMDYAINEDIAVTGGDTYENDVTWDSLTAKDAKGDSFGIPDKNNIMLFATVFNSQPSPKARIPPNKPYIAHYADQTAAAILGAGPSDTISPNINIKQPKDNDNVKGNVEIIADVTDNVGVSEVYYRIGTGTPVAMTNSGTGDEYRGTWDSTSVNDGNVVLQVEATDPSSNNGQSSITVKVQNNAPPDTTPPSVVIQAPTSSETVSGTILVRAMVTDDWGVQKVEYKVDTGPAVNMFLSTSADVYEGAWSTANVNDGSHSLQVSASDYSANSDTQTITVTVDNSGSTVDTEPPELYVRSPKDGDTLRGEEDFEVVASDPSGISKVEYSLISAENKWWQMVEAGPDEYERTFNSLSYLDGNYDLMFRATDKVGNSISDTINIDIQNQLQDIINPGLKVLAPGDGDAISGTIEITVEASDSSGIRSVEYRLGTDPNWLQMVNSRNNIYKGTLVTDTGDIPDGSHFLTIQAEDEAGNRETIQLEVLIDNKKDDENGSPLPGFTGTDMIIASLIIAVLLSSFSINIRKGKRN